MHALKTVEKKSDHCFSDSNEQQATVFPDTQEIQWVIMAAALYVFVYMCVY